VLRDGYNPPLLVPSGPIVVEVNPIYAGLTEALDIHIAATILGVFGAVPDRDRPEDGGGVHGPSPGNDPASMIAGWDIGASHHRSRPRRRGTGYNTRAIPTESACGARSWSTPAPCAPRSWRWRAFSGAGIGETARSSLWTFRRSWKGRTRSETKAPSVRRPRPSPREGRLWKFKLSERDTWVRAGGADSPDDPEAPDSRDDEKG
jgi:hypothetical protein